MTLVACACWRQCPLPCIHARNCSSPASGQSPWPGFGPGSVRVGACFQFCLFLTNGQSWGANHSGDVKGLRPCHRVGNMDSWRKLDATAHSRVGRVRDAAQWAQRGPGCHHAVPGPG